MISLPNKKFPFRKFLITSLHVIRATPIKILATPMDSWQNLLMSQIIIHFVLNKIDFVICESNNMTRISLFDFIFICYESIALIPKQDYWQCAVRYIMLHHLLCGAQRQKTKITVKKEY